MLADGLKLTSGSNIERSLLNAQRGPSLPASGDAGEEFQLLVRDGDNAPGIYEYVPEESRWVIKYPSNDVLPYDVVAGTLGTVGGGAVIGRHLAVRSFKVRPGFEYCLAMAIIAPATNTTFEILKIGRNGTQTQIGSVYFAASETVGIFTQSGSDVMTIGAGEQVVFKAPEIVDTYISDITITLAGTLV